jgi:hypothetical protein
LLSPCEHSSDSSSSLSSFSLLYARHIVWSKGVYRVDYRRCRCSPPCARFTWRHLAGPRRGCQNIVLFKVCHPESNKITRVWPAIACKETSLLIHPSFFRTMPAATS